jgi:phytoene dehydrogenase-like protein
MKGNGPVIVGAGLAGLTAGAYLARAGLEPLILEKSPSCGGLVQSFERDGFVFDTGPRALGNAGILAPMLTELGIDLPLTKGLVSTGMGTDIVHHDERDGIDQWLASLRAIFPGQTGVIDKIEGLVRSSCRMARGLHRLPNPLFKNPLSYPRYLFTRFIPGSPPSWPSPSRPGWTIAP